MEAYDIIIEAGQSNADGTGKGPVTQEYPVCERILYLNAEKKVDIKPTGVEVTYADAPFVISVAKDHIVGGEPIGDFALTFGQDYLQSGRLEEGRKLLIIRAAVGASGFKRGNWGMKDPLYLKMLEMTDYALQRNPENRLVAMLWHQGEHEAVHGTDPDQYEVWMKLLIGSVRERYGMPRLPFVAGDFVPQWKEKNLAIITPIEKKLRKICAEIGNAAFTESEGLISNDQMLNNGDMIHFCRQSLYELGHRYYQAYQTLKV